MSADPTQIVTRVSVGRAQDNDIVLDDRRISRHHVELTPLDGGWVVRDLASGNGTLLNGTPVTAATAAGAGDRLQIGGTTLVLTSEGAEIQDDPRSDEAQTTMVAAATPNASHAAPHRAGDVVNGHVLSASGSWVPVAPSPAQQIQGVQQVIAHVQKPIIPGRQQGIASMVLGIVAWAVGILLFLPFISVVLALIGLPLGLAARKEAEAAGVSNGQAVAGIWLNAIGLALAVLATILMILAIVAIASA
jgi:pSer/pThr/pTyr-binding forkhead associated (FHA) protein